MNSCSFVSSVVPDFMLSIVVPVYNTKRYLSRCIDSLLSQPISAIEIILIDDGSSDGSELICDQYAQDNSHIVVIHRLNEGVVASRYVGIKACHGKYIAFVDSDDWVDEDYFSGFVHVLENSSDIDVCVSGSVREYPDGSCERIGSLDSDTIFSKEKAIEEMVSHRIFRWELWGKVYRRGLFDGLNVDKRVSCHEDLDWNWQIFSKINALYYSGKKIYHYRFNPISATEGKPLIMRKSHLVFERIIDNMWIHDENTKRRILRRYANNIAGQIREMFFFDEEKYNLQIHLFQDSLRELCKSDILSSNQDESYIIKFLIDDYDFCKATHRNVFSSMHTQLKNASIFPNFYVYGTGIVSKFAGMIMRMLSIKPRAYIISN